ncbi:glycosyltransferase [Nesterenkonia pannonica]|uniref:glycosyltransferase n=1 Tax=Nesterenkonia pannonica TaxID=1548602 RepID=UPI002164414F|nr:glycosyltransferase [Nesterenkonia pannonica]
MGGCGHHRPLRSAAVRGGAARRRCSCARDGLRPPKILFLGSLSPRKNPLLLLRALEPLADLEWQLQITGPAGSDPSYAEALSAAARRLSGRVSVTGPLQGHALESAWESADLLTLPSLAETYGMVVTEAIAHGVPAVVGAGTGAVEALASGLGEPSAVADEALPEARRTLRMPGPGRRCWSGGFSTRTFEPGGARMPLRAGIDSAHGARQRRA